MDQEKPLRFYQTVEPQTCSYLPDQKSHTIFIDPEIIVTQAVYDRLAQSGFRRSGEYYYRPECIHCNACIPMRIPVADFKSKKRFSRVLKRNSDLSYTIKPAVFDEKHYQLFEKYINTRHADGDMYPTSEDKYRSFLTSDETYAFFVEFYKDDKLICVTVVDETASGLSAIYTFFDPDDEKRSLGTFTILWLIQHTLSKQLPYLYLGYWVKGSQKMNYKIDYRPAQLLVKGRWVVLN